MNHTDPSLLIWLVPAGMNHTDPSLLIWLVPANVIAGIGAGLIAGLFGLGGGMIIVPAVFLQLSWLGLETDLAFRIAVATALANMLPTSLSSIRSHYQRKSLRPEIARRVAPGLLLGGICGAWLSRYLPVNFLIIVFATLIILVSLMNLLNRSVVLAEQLPSNQLITQSLGLVIGAISVSIGLGGGALITPVLLAFGVGILAAVGTSSLAGLLISVPGLSAALIAAKEVDTGIPFSYGYIILPLIAILIPCGIIAARWGAMLAHKLPAEVLKKAFSAFGLLIGLRMLMSLFE